MEKRGNNYARDVKQFCLTFSLVHSLREAPRRTGYADYRGNDLLTLFPAYTNKKDHDLLTLFFAYTNKDHDLLTLFLLTQKNTIC